MTKAAPCNVLLRAEWIDEGTRRRATAMRLTTSSVFIATETLPGLDASLDIVLSFPGKGAWRLRGCVTHVHLSVEPGSPAGFVATFEHDEATTTAAHALVRSTTQAAAARRRSIRMLHAENSNLLRDMFRYALTKYFAARGPVPTLEQVDSLRGAVSALDGGPLDVAVVDLELPDKTGEEVARCIRARLGRRCWIVGVGLGGAGAGSRMLDAGVDIYLQKPIVLTDLLASIDLVAHEQAEGAVGAA